MSQPGNAQGPAGTDFSELELSRRRYRRGQRNKSVLVSIVSTIIFAAVVWFLLSQTEGWPMAQHVFFNWDDMVAAFPRVWDGFLLNLRVLFFAVIGVVIFGMLLALARTIKSPALFPLRMLSLAYTDAFRGIPLIIVLYLVGFGIPTLRIFDGYIQPEILGTVALVLTYSAYVSEVFRAGIEAVHPSQRIAARSLGLSYGKTLRIVVIPQALRKVTPPLMNDFVAMQKDVGLISVLGAVDAVKAAQIETAADFIYAPYVLAGLLFVLLAIPSTRLADWYTNRLKQREQIGSVL